MRLSFIQYPGENLSRTIKCMQNPGFATVTSMQYDVQRLNLLALHDQGKTQFVQ